MMVVFHVLGCLAVWTALSVAMGLFFGKFFSVGSGDA
jgi:hypothetical protein